MSGEPPLKALSTLRARLGELARVNWLDPAWWGFAGGALALGTIARVRGDRGDDRHLYLSANGGPASDNYMGRERTPPADAASAIAVAVRRARVALEAIAELDGSLPHQPLSCGLSWREGWLERQPLPAQCRRAVFVTARGAFIAELAPGADARIATALGLALSGRDQQPAPLSRVRDDAREATPAAVAVGIGAHALGLAQHVHRRAWTVGGGPWLGVGDAPPLAVVTTCHVVVDGYGHALLSDRILSRTKGPPERTLVAAARLGLGARARGAVEPVGAPAGAMPLSFAGAELDDPGRFVHQAYAFGLAVDRVFRAGQSAASRRAAQFSPTFQVPVAPGDRGDTDRRRRRVVHSLMALRLSSGEAEPFSSFASRIGAAVGRDARGDGLLASLSLGAARAPLPRSFRRRLLRSRRRSHAGMPPFEVLSGRGRLSSIKFSDADRPAAPLYAVSSPTMVVTPADPLGAVVLTLIHHGHGCTATVSGSGAVGTDASARLFLDVWRDELHRVRGAMLRTDIDEDKADGAQ